MNERVSSLASKLDEFIQSMKESQQEMRAENIRRDEAIRDELNALKKQYTTDIAALRKEHTDDINSLRKDDIKSLNETALMLKGAVALIYLLAAAVSLFTKFGG